MDLISSPLVKLLLSYFRSNTKEGYLWFMEKILQELAHFSQAAAV